MANDRDLILMHIEKYGSITAKEADDMYGIMRCASRINELRKQGVPIKTELIAAKNRRGKISNFARYSLEEVGQ